MRDKETFQVMKQYMANGNFNRGGSGMMVSLVNDFRRLRAITCVTSVVERNSDRVGELTGGIFNKAVS